MRPGLHPASEDDGIRALPGCRGLDWDDWPAAARPESLVPGEAEAVAVPFSEKHTPVLGEERQAEAV